MNPRPLLFLLFSISAFNCFSQDKSDIDVTNVSKITLLNPGFSYEARIGKLQTLHLHAYMALSAAIGYSSTFGLVTDLHLDPAFEGQYRYYYNAAGRILKGKRTDLNSMNYLCAIYQLIYSKNRINTDYVDQKDFRPINTLGLAWGMQRNYRKRFSLDLNVGLGYLFTKATQLDNFGNPYNTNIEQATLIANITLGIWLNKR